MQEKWKKASEGLFEKKSVEFFIKENFMMIIIF